MAETQPLSAAAKTSDKGFEHPSGETITDIESLNDFVDAIPGIAPPPAAEPDPVPDPEV